MFVPGYLRRQITYLVQQWCQRIVKTGRILRSVSALNMEVADEIAEPSLGEKVIGVLVRSFQHYGFRSRPIVDGEAVFLGVRGGKTHRIALGSDSAKIGPQDLKEGEVALYHQKGTLVKLDADGHVIVIPGPSAKVKLGDGMDANLDAVVLFTELKSQFDAFVGKYNGHKHTETGTTTNVPDTLATNLTSAVASTNVVAKKP